MPIYQILTGRTPLRLNHTFLDFLSDNALTQINSTPTRGPNILDIFITNRPSLVESCNVVDGISDHEAILVKSPITAHLSYSSKRTIHSWSQADFQVIRNRIGLLCEEFTSFYSSSTPVEILWTNFENLQYLSRSGSHQT